MTIKDVHDNLELPSGKWSDQTSNANTELKLCKLGQHGHSNVVVLSIVIQSDFTWSLTVNGVAVDGERCPAISMFQNPLSDQDIKGLIERLDKLQVCPGHPDAHFIELGISKGGRFKSTNGQIKATLDSSSDVTLNGETYMSTVRVANCAMLVASGKCHTCVPYRNTLRTMYNRWIKNKTCSPTRRTSSSSHVNIRWLNSPEKRTRMKDIQRRLVTAERQIEHMKERIQSSIKDHGVVVDNQLSSDLSHIIREQTPKVIEEFPDGSFQRLFWEHQKESLQKNPRQMRWHPTMIKWCLSIKLKSSGAYESMREFLTLPSSRTLRDYTHYIKASTGFQPEVTEQLMKEAKLETLKDFEKNVVLVFDEVKIKDSLVYDKHGVRIIGFVDVGNINNELLSFERSCQDSSPVQPQVAKHMLVFMVRGLFISLKFPYAQFATRNLSADLIFPLVWEAIQKLEAADFKVVAINCDGASTNRKFFQMNFTPTSVTSEDSQIVYKTKNPYADEERDVYFFSDVPHLIKTVRNCWSNSFAHSNSRALWVSC